MSIKLQKLLSNWPAGTVRAVAALKRDGYSHQLVNRYRKSGWLRSIGEGAVYRVGDKVTLLGGVYALQHDLNLPVHISGLSALELLGRSHYVRHGKALVEISGSALKLPVWFLNYKWNDNATYRSTTLFPKSFKDGLKQYDAGNFKVWISGEAQAMAEYLALVPQERSIEEGKDLMSGLTTLYPSKVQAILEACASIKVRRLFLLLAEVCGHAWLDKLKVDELDLGSGGRTITRGGVYNQKYKLVVPRAIFSEVAR